MADADTQIHHRGVLKPMRPKMLSESAAFPLQNTKPDHQMQIRMHEPVPQLQQLKYQPNQINSTNINNTNSNQNIITNQNTFKSSLAGNKLEFTLKPNITSNHIQSEIIGNLHESQLNHNPNIPTRSQQKKWSHCCPWWVWLIIVSMILSILITVLYFTFRPSIVSAQGDLRRIMIQQNLQASQCKNGQNYLNGKCIHCPPGTIWNGSGCSIIDLRNPNTANPLSSISSLINGQDLYARTQIVRNVSNVFSGDGTGQLLNSMDSVKKVIVQPLVQEPLRHFWAN